MELMIRKTTLLVLAFFALGLWACSGSASQTSLAPTQLTVTPQLPTFTPTFSPTPTRQSTATPVPTFTQTPSPTPAVLIGAGDIANCAKENPRDALTAELIKTQIARYPQAEIFTAGDNVQDEGKAWEYKNCFDPTWGQFKERIHPVPGNHDLMTDNGKAYYEYFGKAAGQPGKGYYSYTLGSWHLVGLNGNCDEIACGKGSTQLNWLKEDLANSAQKCTLLYWHHPYFGSGSSGGYAPVSQFWKAAYKAGAEIVVNGHNHDYERFAPQDEDGNFTPQGGLREFVVGTGGAALHKWGKIKDNSEVRLNTSLGIIVFVLYPDRYEWQFIPVDPQQAGDSGSGFCQ
jgi:hypothetical protein